MQRENKQKTYFQDPQQNSVKKENYTVAASSGGIPEASKIPW